MAIKIAPPEVYRGHVRAAAASVGTNPVLVPPGYLRRKSGVKGIYVSTRVHAFALSTNLALVI